MMFVEVGTHKRSLGKAEVVNQGVRFKNGDTSYGVKWTGPHGEKFEFRVRHDHRRGAWGLAEKVCRRARREMERFYSLPEDKVVDGLIRRSDVPGRYRRAFGKWLGVATVSLVSGRPCPEGALDVDAGKKDEMAYSSSDLRGFLDAMLYGRRVLWD